MKKIANFVETRNIIINNLKYLNFYKRKVAKLNNFIFSFISCNFLHFFFQNVV